MQLPRLKLFWNASDDDVKLKLVYSVTFCFKILWSRSYYFKNICLFGIYVSGHFKEEAFERVSRRPDLWEEGMRRLTDLWSVGATYW